MARRWDLKGRAIVITGGSSGIGAATAVACAKAGMDVAIGARRLDKLENVIRDVRACGVNGVVSACDVTVDDEVQALVNGAYKQFGRLDAVFCNAGLGLAKSLTETTDQEMRYLFEVNYYGTLRLIHAALPLLSQSKLCLGGAKSRVTNTKEITGQIVICSSSVSEIGLPYYGAYCATKSAQDAIASSLRAEMAHRGIWVSSIHPIGTKTEFFDQAGANTRRHTHKWFMQSPQKVADSVVCGMQKLKAEVWPHWPTRIGMAGCTAVPSLAAYVLKRMAKGE